MNVLIRAHVLSDMMQKVCRMLEKASGEAMCLEFQRALVSLDGVRVEILVHGFAMAPPPRSVGLQGECP